MITGTSQKVIFKCDVEADVYLNLTNIGKTNEQLKIKKCELSKLVTIRREGYEDYVFVMDVHPYAVGWMILDALFHSFWLGIPLVVDSEHCVDQKVNSVQHIPIKKKQ